MGNEVDSLFYCTCCGKRGITIMRKPGKGRKAGHLKKLWCINCKKDWNHVEVKPYTHYDYQDFLLEFENNNFDEEGNRKEEYSKFKQRLIKEGKI